MKLLIDGYNLLHASGVFARKGQGELHSARLALLHWLGAHVPHEQLPHTTVVFDAKHAPPGCPRRLQHCGMTILFAAGHREADDLIEQLIQRTTAPRDLTVVSSDRRLQRAARRRRASALDSPAWLRQLQAPGRCSDRTSERGKRPAPADEIAAWLDEFGEVDERQLEETLGEPAADSGLAGNADTAPSEPDDKTSALQDDSLRNPFPPGYLEGLP